MSFLEGLKNVGLLSGIENQSVKNTPVQYKSRRFQYLGEESAKFIEKYAQYASDFYDALAQGLNGTDFFAWEQVKIRMADMIKPSASMTRKIDDHKMILVQETNVDYVPAGAKFITMGSTWLCTNPENISSGYGTGIVQRCNASWNFLDFYGNVKEEPIAVESVLSRANANDPQSATQIAKGYFNVKCQYNEDTAQLDTNSRMILGTGAYAITGFSDFAQEFTADYDSIHLLEFTVRYEEPNFEIDDMENHVAGGKTFSWDISITGPNILPLNGTAKFTASSVRNGEEISSTSEHPFFYVWESSDESVASVDALGNVTANGAGTATITASLSANENIVETVELTVAGEEQGVTVAFLETPPEFLRAYEQVILTAGVFQNGAAVSENVTWSFEGAEKETFSSVVNGNTVMLSCWGGSIVPLTVTIAYETATVSAEILLKGV